jgi:S1/P1 Nuclease
MCRIVVLLVCAFWLLNPIKASAWDFQGHRVVGSIADQMLTDNARTQVQQILNEGAPPDPKKDLTLRLAGPWADCVRSVKNNNGNFEYVVDPDHLEYEVPCIPFRSKAERERMEDYAKRNWTNCQNPPSLGCHTDYHFDDVDIERGGYDRSYQGTNDHDLVAATGAAIAVLKGKPAPAPFSIKDKKEALLMLAHFVGDLHQPLHVGVVYLDENGKLVDPDIAHAMPPGTATLGGNTIKDQNLDLHTQWDKIPLDIGDASTRELMEAARAMLPSRGAIEEWPANWASDTIHVAQKAFMGLSFERSAPPPRVQWTVAYDDHIAYLFLSDRLKRRQLAKGGARLAEILNTIWP